MKTIAILILGLILPAMQVFGQQEKVVLGARAGESSGVSVQFFKDRNKAIEGLLTQRNQSIQLTVLNETYRPINFKFSDNFSWYYGWGGHLGFGWGHAPYYFSDSHPAGFFSGPAAGADLIGGVEYGFEKIPLCLGISYKPFFEFSPGRLFYLNMTDFGFHVKYVNNH